MTPRVAAENTNWPFLHLGLSMPRTVMFSFLQLDLTVEANAIPWSGMSSVPNHYYFFQSSLAQLLLSFLLSLFYLKLKPGLPRVNTVC